MGESEPEVEGIGKTGASTPARHSLIREVGSVTVVALLGHVSTLASVFMLARTLARDDFGHFMLWLYVMNLLGAGALLGFQNALLRQWPRQRLTDAKWQGLFLPLGLLAGGSGLVVSMLFTLVYHPGPGEAILLFLAGTLVGFSVLPATLLQINNRFALGQGVFSLWRHGLLLSVGLLLILGKLGFTAAIFSIAIVGLVQAGLGLTLVRRLPRGNRPIPLLDMVPDALAFTGLQVSAILAARIDSFALPRLLDLDAMGLYAAVGVWSLTGYQITSLALGQVLNPRLASSPKLASGRLVLVVITAGVAAGSLLVLLVDPLLPLLLGQQYAGDHRSLALLLVLSGMLQTLYVFPSSRIGIRGTRPILYSFLGLSLVSIVLCLGLVWILVPRLGLVGAALASALTWAWRTATAWWVARPSS